MDQPLLLSMSDIAELVDERLPVVSTWRNRFKEGPNKFPEPTGGTPARPLFEFEAVRSWVTSNRPGKNLDGGFVRIAVWSAIRSLSDGIDQFELVYWLHQELHLRKAELDGLNSQNGPAQTAANESARKLFDSTRPAAIDTIKSLLDTSSVSDLIEVSDFALGRLSAGYGRSGGDIGAVGSNISVILAAAALAFHDNTNPAPVIYDPSCGIGQTLIEVFAALETTGRSGVVLGIDINPQVADLASIRLGLRDIPATILTADTLSTQHFYNQRPNLIVAEPPLGVQWAGEWSLDDPRGRFGLPPLRNADLAWVVDAASRLEGNAAALVLTSMSALSRGGADERVRANLVRSGAVATVIALPPNLLQYSSVSLALWVLRAPSEDNGTGTGAGARVVSLVDASNPDIGLGGTAKRTEWIRTNIGLWVTSPLSPDSGDNITSASVHLDDLLPVGMDLTPTRWTAQPDQSNVRQALLEENELLAQEARQFKPTIPNFSELPPAPHVVTIGEMTGFADSREAKLWSGRGVNNEEAPEDTITSRDIRSGVIRTTRTNTVAAVALAAESGFRTAPGDIVFTTMSGVRALVDTEGGHRIGNGVQALRLDQSSRFDPHYVALCLAAQWNERYQRGATIKHVKSADLEVPLLPLNAQLQWLAAHRDLETTKSAARKILELAENLEGTAQNALRFGHPETK